MKKGFKVAAVVAAVAIASTALCGCSEIIEGKNDLESFVGSVDSFRSAIENGNYDQLISGLEGEDLQGFLNELESKTGENGREQLDITDGISVAKSLEKACGGLYGGVIDGKVNSDSDKAAYSITLPAKGASMSQRIEAAGKLTVGDALVYCNSSSVKLEGIYYLSSDGGEGYPRGTIISNTDDYFREVEGKAKPVTEAVVLADMFG